MKNIHGKAACEKLNQIHIAHERRMASIEIHQDYSLSSNDSLGTKVCQHHGVPNDKDLVKAEGIPLQQRISEIMKNIHWKASCEKLNQILITRERRMASIGGNYDHSWSSNDSLGTKGCQHYAVQKEKK